MFDSFRRRSSSADSSRSTAFSLREQSISNLPSTDMIIIRAAFDVFDTDKNGALSVAELKKVLTRPGGGSALTDEEVRAIISEFDANDDGEMQFEEFAIFWAPTLYNDPVPVEPPPARLSVLDAIDAAPGSTVRFSPAPMAEVAPVAPVAAAGRKGGASSTGNSKHVATSRKPALAVLQAASPPEPAIKPKKPPTVSEKTLRPSASLLAEAEEASTEAVKLNATAGSTSDVTFERRLGAALMRNAMLSKSKSTLNDLVRAFDRNGDGEVQLIEFRQSVRGTLKLKADNKEIDEFFVLFDTDSGGSLDTAELKVCLKALQDAASAAQEEELALVRRADMLRVRAKALRGGAESMLELEQFNGKLEELRSNQPIDVRLAAVLTRRQIKSVDAISRWRDAGADGNLTREAWRQGLLEYLKGAEAPKLGEADEFFDATTKLDGAPGGKLQLKVVMRKALEKFYRAKEEEERLAKQYTKLVKAASAQQQQIVEEKAAQEERSLKANSAQQQAAKEKEDAEKVALEAKERAKAARLSKKAEEKAAFDAKVEARRNAKGLGSRAPLPMAARQPSGLTPRSTTSPSSTPRTGTPRGSHPFGAPPAAATPRTAARLLKVQLEGAPVAAPPPILGSTNSKSIIGMGAGSKPRTTANV